MHLQDFSWAVILITLAAANDRFVLEKCGEPQNEKNNQGAGGDTSLILVDAAEVRPWPVVIPGGIVVSGSLRLLEDLPPTTVVRITLTKAVRFFIPFNVTVPCAKRLGLGSCEMSVCDFVHILDNVLCRFFPIDRPCGCPLVKGTYSAAPFQHPLPDLSQFAGWVAKGNYRAEVRAVDAANGRQLACYSTTIALTTTTTTT